MEEGFVFVELGRSHRDEFRLGLRGASSFMRIALVHRRTVRACRIITVMHAPLLMLINVPTPTACMQTRS